MSFTLGLSFVNFDLFNDLSKFEKNLRKSSVKL